MYLKNLSTDFVLTAILFNIMVHVDKSVARMEQSKNLKKFLKYDDETISWLEHKRTTYVNPCMKEEQVVTTRSLDTTSKDCPPLTCMYIPSKLKEVKCATSNSLNVRKKTSCAYINIDGDCLDIVATITVMKMFKNNQKVQRNVSLNVGCACMLLTGY